jgi:F420-non-reducing hydrogenase iron-sulfur subunit
MKIVELLLGLSGIGRDRMQLRWVSAAEGQIFANFVTELSQVVQGLGRFKPDEVKLRLAAVEGALNSPRLRWLIGMDRQITEKENVYHARLDEDTYQQLLQAAAEEEYQKALILEVLRDGPQSVREISGRSGLPVYTVSQRLSDVERAGQAEFCGYEGTTPKFIRLAA